MGMNVCQCTPDVWTGPVCQTRKYTSHIDYCHICFSYLAIRILWSFDNNLLDLYNNFPGVAVNGPTYTSPGITGYGACLYLNATASQSMLVYSPPFLNMAYTSLTLFAWVKATTFHNTATGPYSDNAIFGQFEQNIRDHSLHIAVRNQYIYLGFFGDDISGTIFLRPGIWYHVCTFCQYAALLLLYCDLFRWPMSTTIQH